MNNKKIFGLLLLIVTILGITISIVSLSQPYLQPSSNLVLILTVASFIGAVTFLDALNGAHDFIAKIVSLSPEKTESKQKESQVDQPTIQQPDVLNGSHQSHTSNPPSMTTLVPSKRNPIDQDALVNALLDCHTMNDSESRNQVVIELPVEIRTTIRRHSAPKADIVNIVNRCLDFQDGLQKLIERVRYYEGPSNSMRNIDDLLRS